jgi:hypothetical protein
MRSHWLGPKWNTEPDDDLNGMLAGLLDPNSSTHVFYVHIERCAFNYQLLFAKAPRRVANCLLRHLNELSDDKKAVLFHLIVASRDRELAEQFLNRTDPLAGLARYPTFIKALDLLSQDLGIGGDILSRCLDQFLGSEPIRALLAGDADAFNFSGVLTPGTIAHEICSRYRDRLPPEATISPLLRRPAIHRSEASAGPRHAFIGFFGQTRFPESTLKPMMTMMRRELEPWLDAGNLVSCGVSTWAEGGQRVLTHGSLSSDFMWRLPPRLASFAGERNLANFGGFAAHFPAVANRLEILAAQNSRIHENTLREQLDVPDLPVHIAISSEAEFAADLGGAMAPVYPGENAILNQGRMWDRIAGLAPLRRRAEEEAGRPVDMMILLRTDLIFTQRTPVSLLLDERRSFGPDTIDVDFDAPAHYIDGVGDRFWVGRASAIERSFAVKQMIRNFIADEGLLKLYRDRIIWHRFACTALYEMGCQVRTVPAATAGLPFYIFRGRFETAELLTELRQDAAHAPDPAARILACSLTVQ